MPPTLYGRLYGVYAASPTDVWAVGSRSLIATTGLLTMHYDGSTWSQVDSIPWVHSTQRLNSVTGLGSDDVWTVGADGPQPVALHWQGSEWDATAAAPATPTPLPTQVPGCRANFSDVSPNDDYYAFVTYMYCRGIVTGYQDGTFRPLNPVTRGQLARIVVLTYNLPLHVANPPEQHFLDVPPGDPFHDYIETANALNLMTGYPDGTFRPQEQVTRGQLAKVAVSAASLRDPGFWRPVDPGKATGTAPDTGVFSDVPPGSPFFPYVEAGAAHNALSAYKDNAFHPELPSTRAQVATTLYMAVLSAPAYSLNGVAAASATEVWAAGTDGVNPMVLRYNGATWERAALPAPLGIRGGLSGIEVTPGGLVAVGSYSTALPDPLATQYLDQSAHSLVLRYDRASSTWTRTELPLTSPPANGLAGAAAPGETVWAVGARQAEDGTNVLSPLALRSEGPGSRWALMSPPAGQGGTTLTAAAGTGPSDLWVAGWSGAALPSSPAATMYAAHYDGSTWQVSALPGASNGSRLMGLSSLSSHEAWAVGYSGIGPDTLPVILHYVGQ